MTERIRVTVEGDADDLRRALRQASADVKLFSRDVDRESRRIVAGTDRIDRGVKLNVKSARDLALQLGGVIGAAGGAAEAVTGLAGALAPAAGALAAVPAVAAAGGEALGVFKLASVGVTEALTAQIAAQDGSKESAKKAKAAMADLSGEQRRYVQLLAGHHDDLTRLQHAAAEGLLPGAGKGLEAALQNLDVLEDAVGDMGDTLGHLAEQAGELVGSSAWGKDLALVAERNTRIISRGGRAGLELADGLRHVVVEAGPLVNWLSLVALRSARAAGDFAEAKRESGEMREFFADTRDTLEQLADIIAPTARGLGNLMSANRGQGEDILDWIEDAAEAFERWTLEPGDLTEKLRAELAAAIPELAELAGQLGVEAVKHFGAAFIESDTLGRLVLGGLLLRRLGGLAAFRALGVQGGAAMGQGVAAGAAGGGIATGVGRAKGAVKAVAKGVLAVAIIQGIAEGIQAAQDDLSLDDAIASIAHSMSFGAIGRDVSAEMQETFEGLKVSIERFTSDRPGGFSWEQVIDNTKLTEEQREALQKLLALERRVDTVRVDLGRRGITVDVDVDDEEALRAAERLETRFDRMAEGTSSSVRSLRANLRISMAAIARDMGRETKEGQQALKANFAAAIQNVRNSMKAGTIATRQGLAEIRRLMSQELTRYGLSEKQAGNIARGSSPGAGDYGDPDLNRGREGGAQRAMARGGLTTVGHAGEAGLDTVPAVINGQRAIVARGETVAVMTRHQRAVADSALAGVGGLAGLMATVRQEHSKPLARAAAFARGGIVELGKALQAQGYQVGEHPAFGGVADVHAHYGAADHYHGGALDINADGRPGGEAKWLDRLAAQLRAAGWHVLWRVKEHFDHLHVDIGSGVGGLGRFAMPDLARVLAQGVGGTLGKVVQAGLDTARGAAQQQLEDVLSGEGVVPAATGLLASASAAPGRPPNQTKGRGNAKDRKRNTPRRRRRRKLWDGLAPLKALNEVTAKLEGLDGSQGLYGLREMEFNISDEQQLTPEGLRDEAGIGQHLGELDVLIDLRDQVKVALEEQAAAAAAAEEALRTGIAWRVMHIEGIRDKVRQNLRRMREINAELRAERKKKPKDRDRRKITRLEKERDALGDQNHGLAGERDHVGSGGELGRAEHSLKRYRGELPDVREILKSAPYDLEVNRIERTALAREYEEWSGTKPDPAPTAGADLSGINALLREENEKLLRERFTETSQVATLTGFRDLLGLRLVGAFAHGIDRVRESGLAVIHKGETITPDPQGPYGSQLSRAPAGSMEIRVVVETQKGEVLRVVRSELRQNGSRTVSQQLGARARVIAAAPGGR